MYLGGALTILTFPVWIGVVDTVVALVVGLILIAPGGIDGTTQLLSTRESTNRLRVLTGFSLGVGVPLFTWAIVGQLL